MQLYMTAKWHNFCYIKHTSSSWKSPENWLEADSSIPYQLHYRTVSQAIVVHCCSQWRTHRALLLVLHKHYHSCVFCYRNTEL